MRDKDLKNVFRAVTDHGRSILVTALFGAILIYFFAIFGLVTLQTAPAEGDTTFYEDGGVTEWADPDGEAFDPAFNWCHDLWQCTASIMTAGLRKSDIGELMIDRPSSDHLYVWQVTRSFIRSQLDLHPISTRSPPEPHPTRPSPDPHLTPTRPPPDAHLIPTRPPPASALLLTPIR